MVPAVKAPGTGTSAKGAEIRIGLAGERLRGGDAESVSVIVLLYVPTVVGVPETTPVLGLMLKPGGRLDALHV
jgi:hypothetical protein